MEGLKLIFEIIIRGKILKLLKINFYLIF